MDKDIINKTISAIINLNSLNNIVHDNKIENIYNKLFDKLNNTDKYNNKLINLWIDYLSDHIGKFNNIVKECENITNLIDSNELLNIPEREIEKIKLLCYLKKKDLF